MWILLISIVICLFGTPISLRISDLSQVDKLRYDFIDLENKMWKEINDYGKISSTRKEEKPEVAMLRVIEQFGDKIEEQFPDKGSITLKALDNLWVWKRTESELQSISALYKTFRLFQNKQSETGRIPSPPRAWEDLTKTIITDTRSIPEIIDDIDQLISSEKLYLLVHQVPI